MNSDTSTVRNGVIRQLDGNQAIVATPRRGACEKCTERGLCFALGKDKPDMLRALNSVGGKVGDYVSVAMPQGTFLISSLFMYLLPLIGLIAGALIGSTLGGADASASENGSIIGAGLGLALMLAISISFDRLAKRSRRFVPEIIEIRRSGLLPTPDLSACSLKEQQETP